MDKAAAYHSKSLRYVQLRRDLSCMWRTASIVAFHGCEVCCMLVTLPFIVVFRQEGGFFVFLVLVVVALILHICSMTRDFEGDWEVVSVDDTVDDRGMQFSFDGDSIVNYQGYCWHFRRQSQSFGRARTNLCEFDVTVLGGDIMVWTEGSYELAAGVRGSWKSRVLVRLETLRFYSKEKTAVQNSHWCLLATRFLCSFMTAVPLLAAASPVGHAHPFILRHIMWLRPTVCLAMVAALCIRSVFDKSALETLLSSHVLGQVSIAIVAVAFYIPLSIHEYRYGRWGNVPANLKTMGSYHCLDSTSQELWWWPALHDQRANDNILFFHSCSKKGGRLDIVQVSKVLCSPHELQVYSFCHSWKPKQPKVYHDMSNSGQSFSLDNRLKRRAQRVRRNTRYCTISFEFGQR